MRSTRISGTRPHGGVAGTGKSSAAAATQVRRRSRAIKVDEEIYGLIRKNFRPLEDTCNSVLRRLLGLV